MSEKQEIEWIEQALRGDQEAFAHLVEEYQRPVHNLCFRMLGNAQDAEDAAQETFWRAYKALRRFDTKRSFLNWILSIASNYCIDQYRKKKLPTLAMDLMPEETIPFVAPTPEQALLTSEEEKHIHLMLNRLKPQDKAALILRYWYGFSEAEISQSLSLSTSAVKSRMHRAKKKLAGFYQHSPQQTMPVKEAV